MNCPCCGSIIVVPAWQQALETLTPTERRVIDVVTQAPGLREPELAERVYANRWDGGPLAAGQIVRAMIHRANKKLVPYGFRVISRSNHHNLGYRIIHGRSLKTT